MERLKRGHPKHEFNNQKYLKDREMILDQTEDAIDAGIKALANGTNAEIISKRDFQHNQSDSSESSSSSDDSDFDFYDTPELLSTSSKAKKRKLESNHNDRKISKKLKVEYTSEVIFEYFTTIIVEEVAQLIILEFQKRKEEEQENIG